MNVSDLAPLPLSFFARDALCVARDLLDKLIVHGDVVLRISEVEAYRHPDDSANHCRAGRTLRTAPMWGPPGRAYVYLCYGIHALLNLVTNRDGEGAAVLIRGAEAVAGHMSVVARRRAPLTPQSLAGPGKVAQALAVDVTFSGRPLVPTEVDAAGGLYVCDAPRARAFRVGPRIGVDYAAAHDREAPWRLASAESRAVTQPKRLQLWSGTDADFLDAQISPRRTRSSPL